MSDIKYRIGWLSSRIELTENDKEYIEFQMNDLVNETLKKATNNDALGDVSECAHEWFDIENKRIVCSYCDEIQSRC